jgi:hypothetical protein
VSTHGLLGAAPAPPPRDSAGAPGAGAALLGCTSGLDVPPPCAMRPRLYLLSALLVLPAVALAACFVVVGRLAGAARPGGLTSALWRAGERVLPLLEAPAAPPTLLALALGFAALGWSARYRWVGCGLIAAVAIIAIGVVTAHTGPPRTWGDALGYGPTLLGVGLALWQFAADARPRVGRGMLR